MIQTTRRALVASAIRTQLRLQGLTSMDLAEAIGLPTADLEQRLRSRVAFDVDELEVIAVALSVDIAVLLGSSH